MRAIDAEALPRIAGMLLEGAEQDQGFAPGLAALTSWLDADLFHLLGWDAAAGGAFLSVQSGLLEAAAAEYQAHWGHVDPRRGLVDAAPEGTVMRCEERIDARYVARSPFYQDFLLKWDARWLIGGPVLREGSSAVYLGINRTAAHGAFTPDHAKGLRQLMPVLRGAIRSHRVCAGLRQALDAFGDSLQSWGKGALLVDEAGRLLHANDEASGWIGAAGLFTLSRGRLVPTGPRHRRALEQWAGSRRPQAYTVVATHAGRGRPEQVTVTVMAPRADGPGRRRGLLVLVESLQAASPLAPRLLQERFALTAAEARVASGLSAGRSPADIAREAGCTLATVRTHIRRLLDKTHSDGLQGLQRMLASLPRIDAGH